MNKKPSPFRILDALTFGLTALVMTIGAITLPFVAVAGTPASAFALMWVVTLAFWGIYGVVLYHRWNAVRKIDFVTVHNMNVITNGLDVTQDEVEALTDSVIDNWSSVVEWTGVAAAINSADLWVEFRPGYAAQHSKYGKLAGYLVGNNIVIGLKDKMTVHTSALAHELGHVIHREMTGVSSNSAEHEFIRRHGLR